MKHFAEVDIMYPNNQIESFRSSNDYKMHKVTSDKFLNQNSTLNGFDSWVSAWNDKDKYRSFYVEFYRQDDNDIEDGPFLKESVRFALTSEV